MRGLGGTLEGLKTVFRERIARGELRPLEFLLSLGYPKTEIWQDAGNP